MSTIIVIKPWWGRTIIRMLRLIGAGDIWYTTAIGHRLQRYIISHSHMPAVDDDGKLIEPRDGVWPRWVRREAAKQGAH